MSRDPHIYYCSICEANHPISGWGACWFCTILFSVLILSLSPFLVVVGGAFCLSIPFRLFAYFFGG